MTDSEKLDQLIKDVARLDGRMGTFAALHAVTDKQVSKIEGRIWGLLVGVLGAGATSLLSLFMGTLAPHKVATLQTAMPWLAAFFQ